MFKKFSDKLFLVKQKAMLQKELKRLEDQYKLTRKFPEYGTSEDENVQELEKFQENLSLQRNMKNLIKDAKQALSKIEKGTYGVCEQCEGEIESGRLKAYPSADLCVTCASSRFKKAKRLK
jgi:DnaK suppressor protein